LGIICGNSNASDVGVIRKGGKVRHHILDERLKPKAKNGGESSNRCEIPAKTSENSNHEKSTHCNLPALKYPNQLRTSHETPCRLIEDPKFNERLLARRKCYPLELAQ
jgi:hypothetical protein